MRRNTAEVGFFGQYRGQRVRYCSGFKRPQSHEHLVQHHAKCPNVGALIHGLAAGLLGRHVGGCAKDDAGKRSAAGKRRQILRVLTAGNGSEDFGKAEIQHLHRPVGFDPDVGGLKVPVYDAFVMGSFQRADDLTGVVQRRFERHRAFQGLALDQLHHQVVRADVVERADIRVIERSHRTDFALESVGELHAGDFDRNLTTEPRVPSLVDLPHAASANPRLNFVGTEALTQGKGWHVSTSIVGFQALNLLALPARNRRFLGNLDNCATIDRSPPQVYHHIPKSRVTVYDPAPRGRTLPSWM